MWTWRIMCWAVLALTVYSYFAGQVTIAVVLGALTVALFYADFKVSMGESGDSRRIANLDDEMRMARVKTARNVILAITLILGVQLVLKAVYDAGLIVDAPAICIICNHK